MNFPKADTFPQFIMRERSMGPNPLKLCEELLGYADIPAGSVVLDLGSGAGLTSALMARGTFALPWVHRRRGES